MTCVLKAGQELEKFVQFGAEGWERELSSDPFSSV